jgi:protein gp37
MSEKTEIAWCDSTINFWRGCTKVSPGCANCYAESLTMNHMGGGKYVKGVPRVKFVGAVKSALAMNRRPFVCDDCGEARSADYQCCPTSQIGHQSTHRRRVFTNSLSDMWDDAVEIPLLAEAIDTIAGCREVTWIICTKRPENVLPRLKAVSDYGITNEDWLESWLDGRAPVNIILLTSVENQGFLWRVDELNKIPCACRGINFEPLLGEIRAAPLHGISWLIIGGESGPGARPCHVDWIRSLVAQGKTAGVAIFVKQLGAEVIGQSSDFQSLSATENRRMFPANSSKVYLRDKKGGDRSEWPVDLPRLRQFPNPPPSTQPKEQK